jgi:hypothetical protein
VPIIAPFEFAQAVSNVVLSFIPKPTSTGFLSFKLFSFCRYVDTSTISLSFPVVDDEETAYKKPELNSSSFLILASLVSGVTRNIKSSAYFFMMAPYSVSNSCSGRSGSIRPSTPTVAASAQNF